MRNIALLIFSLEITLLISCTMNQTKKPIHNQIVSAEIKYEMFEKALFEDRTAPYYVLLHAKNKNTGETKDICTEAPYFISAICKELNCNEHEANKIALEYKDRFFEFSNDSALTIIDFNLYTAKDLEIYEQEIDIEKIIEEIKAEKFIHQTFHTEPERLKKQTMFAHIMINHGCMVDRGCIAGNILGLEIYK
jgi:hypothetical protein